MASIFECNFHWHSSSYLLSSSSSSQLVLLWESLTNATKSSHAFSQRVLFRVHEGVHLVSDFLLKIGGDSASYSIDERIPFQKLCDVWPTSSNNNTSYLVQHHNTGTEKDCSRHMLILQNRKVYEWALWGGEELEGVSKVVLSRKGKRYLFVLLWMDWITHRKIR